MASSQRDGRKLICVVMNAPDWFNDSYRLMDWAYDHYELATAVEAGGRVEKIPLEGGVRDTVWVGVKEEVTCLILPEERDHLAVACDLEGPVTAPIRRGDEAGLLHLYLSGEYVYSLPLYFMEDVDEVTTW